MIALAQNHRLSCCHYQYGDNDDTYSLTTYVFKGTFVLILNHSLEFCVVNNFHFFHIIIIIYTNKPKKFILGSVEQMV